MASVRLRVPPSGPFQTIEIPGLPVVLVPAPLPDVDGAIAGIAGTHAVYSLHAELTATRNYVLIDGAGSEDGDQITVRTLNPLEFSAVIDGTIALPPAVQQSLTQFATFIRAGGVWVQLYGGINPRPNPFAELLPGLIGLVDYTIGVLSCPLGYIGQPIGLTISGQIDVIGLASEIAITPVLTDGIGEEFFAPVLIPGLPVGGGRFTTFDVIKPNFAPSPFGYQLELRANAPSDITLLAGFAKLDLTLSAQ